MKQLTRSILVAIAALAAPLANADDQMHFDLEASFLVCDNSSCDDETSSEIIAASADGMTLVYSDSPGETVGLIDITDPASPAPLGAIDISGFGEPTSVAVFTGKDPDDNAVEYILVGVNTSPGFDADFDADHSGQLHVYDLAACKADSTCTPVAMIDLGGQPDSVAVSPDGAYVAVAIENERDEAACHTAEGALVPAFHDEEDDCIDAGHLFGRIPQPGPGWLAVIRGADSAAPADWTVDTLALAGLDGLVEASDPEPEYVHINANNQALVSLQENNAFVIVDLASLAVDDSFSAGSVDLENIDDNENDLIELKANQSMVPREPDGVSWIGNDYFASANEGDMDGGSRGFTIFAAGGGVVYESYESYDWLQTMHAHYPEDRSENKGSEPEAVTFAPGFGGLDLLFVASERANTVAVYDITADKTAPQPLQFLPAVMGPESVIAIPSRGLVIIANEVDDAARSMVNIYQWEAMPDGPDYPTVASMEDPASTAGAPIPFGALSGLTPGADSDMLDGVHDSYYVEPRIFHIDAGAKPAMVTGYTKLSGIDQDELDAYDLEGIARRPDGGYWLVSEGSGNADGLPDPGSSTSRPFRDENLLIRVAADGEVLEQISLPADIAAKQFRFGFEGVAVTGSGDEERVYVAFQREWLKGEPAGIVRIGEYNPNSGNWKFHWYPLDPVEASEGWVGLSEIVAVAPREFLVLERDNQAGPFAFIKRIYHVDLDDGRDAFLVGDAGKNGKGKSYPVLRKTLAYDLLPDYQALNGWVPDKPEGMTIDAEGKVYVVTDNDGVDDAPGQTWLFNVGELAY
jgi:DNA-binding beta-propeller fold protein YncE